jgi:poly(3-hydroxybutyrate) depolymerase
MQIGALAAGLAGASLVLALVACGSGPSALTDAASAKETTAAAVRLKGDRNACPDVYKTQAPVAGHNTGYLVDGQSRDFTMLLPDGDPAAPHPLLINFHGTGGDGDKGIEWEHLTDFVARGFIVLAPTSAGNGTVWPVWDGLRQPGTENDPNKDMDYFDSLVACVASYVPVDAANVFAGGHSAGGIMTNYVLQRRSQLLAGGVVASGVFSLTSPVPAPTLDPMFVIVTWGGSNDSYHGNGIGFDFINEASLASKFYANATNVTQVDCHGNDLGHTWLYENNTWLIDRLLEHPKGKPSLTGPLPPAPPESQSVCVDTPFEGKPPPAVTCGPSSLDGCQQFCQFVGDCAVENTTIQPALHDQIVALGFSGTANTDCGGCVTQCATHGTGTDPQVLSCFKDREASATCGQGVEGVLPLVDAVNACCQDRTDSPLCMDVCRILMTQPQAGAFFPTCSALTGQ